jgi:hypothetical protein
MEESSEAEMPETFANAFTIALNLLQSKQRGLRGTRERRCLYSQAVICCMH